MKPQTALPLPAEPAAAVPCLQPVVVTTRPPPAAPQLHVRRKAVWLALRFPAWPLVAVLAGASEQQRAVFQAQPFAVIDQDRKRRVLVCNEHARSCGLRPGHALNAAIALCGDLQVAERNMQREAELLETAARSCQRYTSTVSIEPPNQLLLEVRGSLRLFGGVVMLVKRVLDDFQSRGITAHAAVTPTARSALWLSRCGQSQQIILPRALPAKLAQLPIEILHWPPEVTLRLSRFGVGTLADLRRLPRGGLARRIGAQHLLELDAAFGKQPELRRSVAELPGYRDRVVLDAEIETTGLLEPLIAQRLVSLEQFLIARTLALTELEIELVHRIAPPTKVHTGLAMPSTDMSHLQTLLRERLHAVQLPEPILELRLRAVNMVPAVCRSRQLLQSGREPGEGVQQRVARLMETLESRLGKHALRALRVVADHRPEHAQSHAPLTGATPYDAKVSVPEWLPQRPLWLLREPEPLKALESTLRLESGPETIEAGWWDNQPCKREYFIARCKQGALHWIFRDLTATSGNEWYLHGLFG